MQDIQLRNKASEKQNPAKLTFKKNVTQTTQEVGQRTPKTSQPHYRKPTWLLQ
jgi:hypothetical protein